MGCIDSVSVWYRGILATDVAWFWMNHTFLNCFFGASRPEYDSSENIKMKFSTPTKYVSSPAPYLTPSKNWQKLWHYLLINWPHCFLVKRKISRMNYLKGGKRLEHHGKVNLITFDLIISVWHKRKCFNFLKIILRLNVYLIHLSIVIAQTERVDIATRP